MANKQGEKYWSGDRLRNYPTAYKLVISERSNGKTYDLKKYAISQWRENGGKFAYVRRLQSQITRKEMKRLFEDQNDEYFDEYGDYIHYSVDNGFFTMNKDGIEETCGYPFSIEMGTVKKGIPWNDIKIIIFDEFLEFGKPIENEIAKFMNLISTIVRKREDVEIFMAANTITKFSPYYELFKIDPLKLKKGNIFYGKHKRGVTFAIERCDTYNLDENGQLAGNKYLGFDDSPTADMILYGEWEYDIVNTKEIDGIGWNSKRLLIPMYITAIKECYELTLYESDNPILFIRKINTQRGEVRKDIKFNLSYDNSLRICNINGIIPTYGKVNKLMGQKMIKYWDLIKLCIDAKRVVYDKIESGSDFMKIYKYL